MVIGGKVCGAYMYSLIVIGASLIAAILAELCWIVLKKTSKSTSKQIKGAVELGNYFIVIGYGFLIMILFSEKFPSLNHSLSPDMRLLMLIPFFVTLFWYMGRRFQYNMFPKTDPKMDSGLQAPSTLRLLIFVSMGFCFLLGGFFFWLLGVPFFEKLKLPKGAIELCLVLAGIGFFQVAIFFVWYRVIVFLKINHTVEYRQVMAYGNPRQGNREKV